MGASSDRLVISGGTATFGGASRLVLDFELLDPAERPDADPLDAFWEAHRQWTVVEKAGGTIAGQFAALSNAVGYAAGEFLLSGGEGADIVLAWNSFAAPSVITVAATGVTATASWLNGEVTGEGDHTVTNRGFVYASTPGVTLADTALDEGDGLGTFTALLAGLTPNTRTYFRAFAANAADTTLGAELNFLTPAETPPAPTVDNPTAITLDVTPLPGANASATTFAILSTNDGQYVQGDGSLGASPLWQTAAAWGTVTVAPLTPGTLYGFQVVARNDDLLETGFGPIGEGTTGVGVVVPLVATVGATGVTATAAWMDGNVIADGGDTVTDRGIVHKPSPGVTATDNPVSAGAGTGLFSADVSGLTPDTLQYFRAYAANSEGTGLGAEMSVRTLAATPGAPVVDNPATLALDVTLSPNGNPAHTPFAILHTNDNRYVQADGGLGASPVWATAAAWGTVTVTGLTAETLHGFSVKARNADLEETPFGPVGEESTLRHPPIDLNALDAVYRQDFGGLASTDRTFGSSDQARAFDWIDGSTLPGWYLWVAGATPPVYYTSDGEDRMTPVIFSLGNALSFDDALGTKCDNASVFMGAEFRNNTGAVITNLHVRYAGEAWRRRGVNSDGVLTFGYSTNATGLADGEWQGEAALNYATFLTGTNPANPEDRKVDGNADANRRVLEGAIAGLAIPQDAHFWLRWTGDTNGLVLAIDDLEVSPSPIPQPAIELERDTPYVQQFDELAGSWGRGNPTAYAWANGITLHGWYAIVDNGTPAWEIWASIGNSTAQGRIWNFGTDENADDALGSVNPANGLRNRFGARFVNRTGGNITELHIAYVGEQWRRQGDAAAETLAFAYSLNARSIMDGAWTEVSALHFITPNTGSGNASLDGNAPGNRTPITHTLTGLNIPDGTGFWIRWTDGPSSQFHGMAIDDFSISTTVKIVEGLMLLVR